MALVLAAVAAHAQGQADPPGRVGLLNYNEGSVALSPAGDTEWLDAPANRPLTQGDRLWTDKGSRAEVHAGAIALRLDGQTHAGFLALDTRLTRLQVAQGSVQVRLRELLEGDDLQLDTPNLSFRALQAGDYRIDVDPASGTTRVTVHAGTAMAYGDGGQSLPLGGGQQIMFRGRALGQVGAQEAPPLDAFDRWAGERDRREDQSISARYLPRDVTGYLELDSHGKWSRDPALGPIWIPGFVDAGWAPYRQGRWDSIAPWGWTWIDDAKWGFATSHYGRWSVVGARWAWVPGRLPSRPLYSPALVGFAGNVAASGNVRLASGRLGVAWFPLAPGEAWKPGFQASPVYVSNVNRNVGGTPGGSYVHLRPEAITAITVDEFLPGSAVRPRPQQLASGEAGRSQSVAPPPEMARTPTPADPSRLQIARVAASASAVRPMAVPRPGPAPMTITHEQVQLALQAQRDEQARRAEAQRAKVQRQPALSVQVERVQARRAAQTQVQMSLASQKAERKREQAQREVAVRGKQAQREAVQAQRRVRALQLAKAAGERSKHAQARRSAQARETAAREEAESQNRQAAHVRRALGLADAEARARGDAQARRSQQLVREEREKQEAQRRQILAPFTGSPPSGGSQQRERRS